MLSNIKHLFSGKSSLNLIKDSLKDALMAQLALVVAILELTHRINNQVVVH